MGKQVEGGSEILCSGQMIGSLTWVLLMGLCHLELLCWSSQN